MSVTQLSIFFIHNPSGQGWGESMYSGQSPASLIASLSPLVNARLAVLSDDVAIIATRASVVGKPPDSELVEYSPGLFGNIGSPTAGPNDCFNYRFFAANGSKRIFPFRGIPEYWFAKGQRTPVGLSNNSLFGAVYSAYKDLGCGLLVPDPANLILPITSITTGVDAGAKAIVVMPAIPTGLTYGSKVRLRSVRSNSLYNGVWTAIPINATSFQLAGSGNYYVNDAGPATAQLLAPTVSTLSGWSFQKVSTRETGHPFGLRRGRRPAKIRHR